MIKFIITYLIIGIIWSLINLVALYINGKSVYEDAYYFYGIDEELSDLYKVDLVSYMLYDGSLPKRYIVAIVVACILLWPICIITNLYVFIKLIMLNKK